MEKFSDTRIVSSWKKNSTPWIKAVRQGEIASRKQVTDAAIVTTIADRRPKSVLDIGCGEGWLIRALSPLKADCLGIDVVPELIEAARQGGGRFSLLAYEDLNDQILKEKFDVAVCNFSLIGKESVNHVFQQVPNLLNDESHFIVQTLHPIAGCGEHIYQDGWREGSWDGFSAAFSNPAPWYFRTLETWQSLFNQNGLIITETLEPLDPTTNKPSSIIFVATSRP